MSGAVSMVDYKKIQGMAGRIFPRDKKRSELESYGLDLRQVEFFKKNGYLTPHKILEPGQVELMREGLARMIEENYPRQQELIGLDTKAGLSKGQQMIYFQGAWLVEEAFHDILYHPAVTVPVSQLLDSPRVRFLHDQLFYKPARHGGVVAWHQDYSYWTRTVPCGHLTCFLALDDTTLENGCMHVIPGSHLWKLLPATQLVGGEDAMERIKSALTPEQLKQFKPEPIKLKAGECSFHHPLTLHGSYSNRSDQPRRALVLNYMNADTRSDSDQPIMPGSPPVPRGAVIEGEYFPLVLDGGAN